MLKNDISGGDCQYITISILPVLKVTSGEAHFVQAIKIVLTILYTVCKHIVAPRTTAGRDSYFPNAVHFTLLDQKDFIKSRFLLHSCFTFLNPCNLFNIPLKHKMSINNTYSWFEKCNFWKTYVILAYWSYFCSIATWLLTYVKNGIGLQ